jgi:hypothetical protein
MATQTKRLAHYEGTSGTCDFEYDYDDVSLLVTAYRCRNNSGWWAHGQVWRINDPSVKYPLSPNDWTAPGATFTQNVPSGQAQRLQLVVVQTSHGPMLDGMDGLFDWAASLRPPAQ